MDDNKKIELKDIGYKISGCCALCIHSEFPSPKSLWGTCKKHGYDHKKHGNYRQLSICRHGSCPLFDPDASVPVDLGAFVEFIDF